MQVAKHVPRVSLWSNECVLCGSSAMDPGVHLLNGEGREEK